ncbi:DUF2157 domain-containing protein [Flexithrix dorotheae]|uniref:DUF2157 domain-containing protein n=1 Tax=Flexithrix dorotheae TaxID=70993 RepID=UPI00036711B0|nr:DUF2157 domain-containing protein [Flexithrix dorotheae]
MEEKTQQKKVTRKVIHYLIANHIIRKEKGRDLFSQTGIYPNEKAWLKFLNQSLMVLGVVFSVCGIIFFFAYNWTEMHKFFKLGLIEAGIIGVALFIFFKKPETFAFKIGLTALVLITGALFATFGQIYQTGANAYDFFLNWTLVVTIWVIISRFPLLWLIYLILINTTVVLYAEQVLRHDEETELFVVLLGINGVVLLVWEWFSYHQKSFSRARWFPRIVAMAPILILTVLTNSGIDNSFHKWPEVLGGVMYVLMIPVCYFIYTKIIRDLFILVLLAISLISVINFLIFEKAPDDLEAFFLSGFFSIAMTVLLVWQFVRLGKQWKEEVE